MKENRINNQPVTITKSQARRFLLAYQNLLPEYQLEGKEGILAYIKQVGCIQFDPLNIVGHNPELVLQSRIRDFYPEMLTDLLYKERKLLDGWDKNMSIYPVEDWPCFQRLRERARSRFGNKERPAVKILDQVRESIKKKGPLSSIDLDYDQVVGWSWSPTRLARAALESMYAWGELVIHHKVHTRKVYDFAANHIPEIILHTPDPNLTMDEFYDWYIERRIGSIGLLWNKSGGAWLGISGMKSKERGESITRLCAEKKISEIRIKGIRVPFYIKNSYKKLLAEVLSAENIKPGAVICAPLDNMLWDRQLIKELFDFEYRWEVYKPVSERQYGYYVLPVLYKDRFIARFEPGHDKKNKVLVIKNWWWEKKVVQTQKMQSVIKKCLKRFMQYLGVNTIKVECKEIKFG